MSASSSLGHFSADCVKANEILSSQVQALLAPELEIGLRTMISQAEDLVHQEKGDERDVLEVFLKALDDVPTWNSNMIDEETKRIVSKHSHLPMLIAACIVAGTQVLFSIRPFNNNDDREFELQTPDVSTVIHNAYRFLAKRVYTLLEDESTLFIRASTMHELCTISVSEALKHSLPTSEIMRFIFGSDLAQFMSNFKRQMMSTNPLPAAPASPASSMIPHPTEPVHFHEDASTPEETSQNAAAPADMAAAHADADDEDDIASDGSTETSDEEDDSRSIPLSTHSDAPTRQTHEHPAKSEDYERHRQKWMDRMRAREPVEKQHLI